MLSAACIQTEENHQSALSLLSITSNRSEGGLITSNTSLLTSCSSLLSSNFTEGGMDFCSFYSGPSDASIMAFGESFESLGAIAYEGGESCGSIAFAGGGESCGSIASSSGGGFSGGGCCYSC